MTPAPRRNLIEELDARQNEVITKLDQLNAQVEGVIQAETHSLADAETGD